MSGHIATAVASPNKNGRSCCYSTT